MKSRPVAGGFLPVDATREFFVHDDGIGTAITKPEQVIALFGTATVPDALPIKGTPFPGMEALVALTYSIALEDGHTALWRVTWQYKRASYLVQVDPGEIGYLEWSLDEGREFQDTWRENPTIPPFGIPNGYADIGGISVDSGEQPGSGLRLQQVLEISEVMSVIPQLGAIAAAVGARNSQPFEGANIGRVVLLPAKTTRIGVDKFRVNWRFSWDEYYHMQQRPLRDVNNNVKKVGGSADEASAARTVYWFQPFKRRYDFNSLSDKW